MSVATHLKLNTIVNDAFREIKRELGRLACENADELARAKKELEVVHAHLKKADSEIERLTQRLDECDSKLAIRDSEITRLEVQLEDARRSPDPKVRL
jgi:chromosome segregation ATPase